MLQFGIDKFLHFVGGACVMAITNSWIILAIVAIGKEVYDQIIYKGFDIKDAFATVAGGIFAYYANILWAMIPFTIL